MQRERECCIIFKSQPLGSVKTSDEYREACGGVYVLVVVFVCTILPQCCLCVRLKGLYQCVSAGLLSWPPGASGTTDTRAKFTSVKVIYMKQALDMELLLRLCWTSQSMLAFSVVYSLIK